MRLNLSHIGQIALPVTDVERSEAFYKDVLGLAKLYRYGDLTFLDCAGVRLLLEKSKEAFTPQGCIYFRCADIALAVNELAFFTDPDGHMLAIMQEAPKGYAPSKGG
jgi:catechol 2,3-dioxygenase-like lactoylglutathione lyase family enzyme